MEYASKPNIVVYYQNFLKISIFVLCNNFCISSKIETSNERNTKARKLIILRQIYIDIPQMSSSDWKCIRNMMCILTLMMTCTVWNNHRGKSKHHLQQRFRGMRREQWAIAEVSHRGVSRWFFAAFGGVVTLGRHVTLMERIHLGCSTFQTGRRAKHFNRAQSLNK